MKKHFIQFMAIIFCINTLSLNGQASTHTQLESWNQYKATAIEIESVKEQIERHKTALSILKYVHQNRQILTVDETQAALLELDRKQIMSTPQFDTLSEQELNAHIAHLSSRLISLNADTSLIKTRLISTDKRFEIMIEILKRKLSLERKLTTLAEVRGKLKDVTETKQIYTTRAWFTFVTNILLTFPMFMTSMITEMKKTTNVLFGTMALSVLYSVKKSFDIKQLENLIQKVQNTVLTNEVTYLTEFNKLTEILHEYELELKLN